jgi:transcriptional regulator with XRE-family HTH domain
MSEDARAAGALDKQIGRNVRRRRLEIGMSQETLAGLLGVTFQQVQKYEKGVNRTAASRLWDIAQALECSVAELYPRAAATAAQEAVEPLAAFLETPEGVRLARAFLAAPEASRAGIADIVVRVARVAASGGFPPGEKRL